MKFFILQPEVPGFGVNIDEGRIEMVVEVPPHDDFLAEDFHFFVTENLLEQLKAERMSGFDAEEAAATLSEQRKLFSPELRLQSYFVLKIYGRAGVDDFGMYDYTGLVVSENALEILKCYALANCEIAEFQND